MNLSLYYLYILSPLGEDDPMSHLLHDLLQEHEERDQD